MKLDTSIHLTNFEINPTYDIEGYMQIVKTAPSDIRPNNLLTSSKDISDLVNHSFLRENDYIFQRVSEISLLWKGLEQKFIDLCSVIFDSESILHDTYVCYPTVCPLIARDPIKHRIAFPYNCDTKLACYVIAHELLHEFFFHYVYRIYGNDIDLNSRELWDLSEVINVLIMQENEWTSLLMIIPEPYDIHRELLFKLKPIWESNRNIDLLVKSFMNKSI